jgi:hypothetical protein
MARLKANASDEVSIPPSSDFDLNSLAQGGPDIVTVPADTDIRKLCEDEAFMNEMIEIVCKASGDPNAPKAVEISVQSGGITGPMGKPTAEHPSGTPGIAGRGGKLTRFVFSMDKKYTVPRFVFEALAHAKTTTLRQAPHPTIPMQMTQRNVHSYSYNFEVTRDPNPRGQAWREKVLADPA